MNPINDEINQQSPVESESPTQNEALTDSGKLKVIFALPNLQIDSPFETKFVGLLPSSDPRVKQIAKRDPAARALINGFSNRHGAACPISVMVIHENAPPTITNVTALFSFRNIFAFSCIIQGWGLAAKSGVACGILYSDYFDFYPYSVTKDGKELLHDGEAEMWLDSPENFCGQLYPDLPAMKQDRPIAITNEKILALLKES